MLDEKPWCAEVLCRGLEFSSYAFATDRKTVRDSKLNADPSACQICPFGPARKYVVNLANPATHARNSRLCMQNVSLGTLFDTPTFMWLDAYETKRTCFFLSLQSTTIAEGQSNDNVRCPIRLESDGRRLKAIDGSGVELSMHEQPSSVQLMAAGQIAGGGKLVGADTARL